MIKSRDCIDREDQVFRAPGGAYRIAGHILVGILVFMFSSLLPLFLGVVLHQELGVSEDLGMIIACVLFVPLIWAIALLIRRRYRKRYGFMVSVYQDSFTLSRGKRTKEIAFGRIRGLQFVCGEQEAADTLDVDIENSSTLTVSGAPIARSVFGALSCRLQSLVSDRLLSDLRENIVVRFSESAIAKLRLLLGGILIVGFAGFLIVMLILGQLGLVEGESNRGYAHFWHAIGMLFAAGAAIVQLWTLRRRGVEMDRDGIHQKSLFKRLDIPWNRIGSVDQETRGTWIADAEGGTKIWLSSSAYNHFVLERLMKDARGIFK